MIVNGKQMDLPPGTTIYELLQELNISPGNIVVAINLVVVPKEKYSTILNQEDQVELIRLVGGG